MTAAPDELDFWALTERKHAPSDLRRGIALAWGDAEALDYLNEAHREQVLRRYRDDAGSVLALLEQDIDALTGPDLTLPDLRDGVDRLRETWDATRTLIAARRRGDL